jgi:phosphate transport system permease protein
MVLFLISLAINITASSVVFGLETIRAHPVLKLISHEPHLIDRPLQKQRLGFGLLTMIAVLTVVPIVGVVVFITLKGAPAISQNSSSVFIGTECARGHPACHCGNDLFNHWYSNFFNCRSVSRRDISRRIRSDNIWTRTIRIAIINLAGIPSVVNGLFGLGFIVLFLRFGTSILAASLTLAIMTLPVIISTTEESLRAVPQAFRTVSISLGATRWQTIRRIVLQEALPGMLTGVILGLERAAGETAPILFTGAAFFLPRLPSSPFNATMALPYHLFVISTQVPEMPIQIQYGTAVVLLVFVLTMNLIATIIRSRARAKRQW